MEVGNHCRQVGVQHHVAHVLGCAAENEVALPALGVAWDGTGYGTDGTVWGGEFFEITERACERIAHLRTFGLPGGERAVKEPRRSALGVLFELFGSAAFEMDDIAPVRETATRERATIRRMLERGLNSPRTSSAGRLFDAVAAMAGLRQETRFEGQAAMELEFAADAEAKDAYPFPGPQWKAFLTRTPGSSIALDWEPLVRGVLDDVHRGVGAGIIAARFHNAMSELIVQVAICSGFQRVALSGGCFQNRVLTERTVHRLRAEGIHAFWHQRVPPNDGGIALGQVVAAIRAINNEE
jgi:hydrogenase maturation protein HypF